MKYIVFIMKTIVATGDGQGRRKPGDEKEYVTSVVSLSWRWLGLSHHLDTTPASPHEGPGPLCISRTRQRGFAPPARAFSLWATVSALHLPTVPSPSPVSIIALGWRVGERHSSQGCHSFVSCFCCGCERSRPTARAHNRASFISGGKRSQSSGSASRWEEVQVMAVPAPSPPVLGMFKLPRRRFASRFRSLHLHSY